eukprot:204260-Pelagomonas_calceolata.AAC.4
MGAVDLDKKALCDICTEDTWSMVGFAMTQQHAQPVLLLLFCGPPAARVNTSRQMGHIASLSSAALGHICQSVCCSPSYGCLCGWLLQMGRIP